MWRDSDFQIFHIEIGKVIKYVCEFLEANLRVVGLIYGRVNAANRVKESQA